MWKVRRGKRKAESERKKNKSGACETAKGGGLSTGRGLSFREEPKLSNCNLEEDSVTSERGGKKKQTKKTPCPQFDNWTSWRQIRR